MGWAGLTASFALRSETQSQGQLNFACMFLRQNAAEIGTETATRLVVVALIQRVEKFRTKLKIRQLLKPYVLEQ